MLVGMFALVASVFVLAGVIVTEVMALYCFKNCIDDVHTCQLLLMSEGTPGAEEISPINEVKNEGKKSSAPLVSKAAQNIQNRRVEAGVYYVESD